MHRLVDLFIAQSQDRMHLKRIESNHEYEKVFQKLKDICTSTPILAYANFTKLLKLHTDVCILGLDAVLYKNQDGIIKVIGYASRFLSTTEHKNLAHKFKFLALKGIQR